MSECVYCGRVGEPEHGVVVGLLGSINENVCNVCWSGELERETTLSEREAEVAALKQLGGYSHNRIAGLLDIDKSTVDEYSRRITDKIRMAEKTIAELEDLR